MGDRFWVHFRKVCSSRVLIGNQTGFLGNSIDDPVSGRYALISWAAEHS